MSWMMPVVLSTVGFILQQSSSPPPSVDALGPKPGMVDSGQCGAPKKMRTKKAPPAQASSCIDTKKSLCELSIGEDYLGLGLWEDALQHCEAAMAANPADHSGRSCVQKAQVAIQARRSSEAAKRLILINNLISGGSYVAAQEQLKAWTLDEQQATGKHGLLESASADIRDATARLAAAQRNEWPQYLPKVAGFYDWFPGVVSVFGRVVTFCLFGIVLYWVLLIIRNTFRGILLRKLADPSYSIRWLVSGIEDSTKQSAAGALIDALNVDYNPLFQKLYTSSFLAAPPALLPAGQGGESAATVDASTSIFRNLFVELLGLPSDLVRPYLSALVEDLYMPVFRRHRFIQVYAFENINLKLGIVEASLGAIANTVRNWWTHGWPTVTGSVLFEEVNKIQLASVRLIANLGMSEGLMDPVPPGNMHEQSDQEMVFDDGQSMSLFYSQDRTLSVFASTQVDETADAVALASQRAAFRLLYRLARRPADPALAIAASSYRQGVRLLNTVL